MDSTKETQDHIDRVKKLLCYACLELIERGIKHDASKLEEPEKSYFDAEAGTVENLVYGSDAYRESCERLKPALLHHYANNSHHPQYYGEELTNGMNLFDIVEMFFDWKASTERTKDGNIYNSIKNNQSRLGISKQLAKIFVNTAKYLGYEEPK